ncbi:MAG: uroporphyrinogen decarboxylase [Elusimicrobia bacterium]|nr:uroporphyrinogen decarboxylase [Elusimicrobiota bacterium]
MPSTAAPTSPRFLEACRRRKTDATPIWLMRQAGRYLPEYRKIRETATLLEMCERPELAAEVTLQPLRRFDLDAAILFADILLVPRAMGLKLEFVKGEGPVLTPPIRSRRELARLREPDPHESLGFVLDAVRIVRRELAPGKALIGFAGAPFTVASYMVEGGPSDDYRTTKAMMHGDAPLWRALMMKLSRATIRYLRAQVEAGAQAVQLFDSWVGSLSPEDYERFVRPYSKLVIDEVSELGVPVISFGTGNSGFLDRFAAAGGDVVGADWRIPLDEAWSKIGRGRAIQGNLDPVLLTSGPTRAVLGAARRILERAGGRPGHIFNLGHGVLPTTPPERVKALVDFVHHESAR